MSLDLTASGDGALLLPELVLRETSPLVYDWSASEQQIYSAAPRTGLPNAYDIPAPGAPQVTEDLYITRDGGGLKVLAKISWEASPSGFVAQYQLQARQGGTGNWIDYGRTDGTTLEIRDIAPGAWAFRVKAISVLGVSSPWQETQIEILGLTAPPAQLENVTLQTAGGRSSAVTNNGYSIDVAGRINTVKHAKPLATKKPHRVATAGFLIF